ncbi:Rhodanese-like domain-containing protein [Mycena epipterygia]|nr:Rhodanese-like domain-containing protein [Mycena epipterygia]
MVSETQVPLLISPTSPFFDDPSAVILDATWLYGAPSPSGDAFTAYLSKRLPRARFWSLDEMSEPNPDGFKYMLPSPERFARAAGEHGITRSSHIIIYDTQGAFSAPRTAFTFFAYGHEKLSLIDGGLYCVADAGIELETGPPQPFESTYYPTPQLHPNLIAPFSEISCFALSPTDETVILDGRNAESFHDGHIPHADSLPWKTTLDVVHSPSAPTGVYYRLPSFADFERRLVAAVGADKARLVLGERDGRRVIHSCGGGISAAIAWIVMQANGINSAVYDESWSGYSSRKDAVIARGSNLS